MNANEIEKKIWVKNDCRVRYFHIVPKRRHCEQCGKWTKCELSEIYYEGDEIKTFRVICEKCYVEQIKWLDKYDWRNKNVL